MKKLIFILSIFIFITIPINAVSLDAYIAKMQNVSPERRVKMMNKLKKALVNMNKSQRKIAIEKLRAKNNITDRVQATVQPDVMMRKARDIQMDQVIFSQRSAVLEHRQIIDTQRIKDLKNNSTPSIPLPGN